MIPSEMYSRFLDSIHHGVFVIDSDMKILMANSAAYRLLPKLEIGALLKTHYPKLFVQIEDGIHAALEGTRNQIERLDYAFEETTRYLMMSFNPIERSENNPSCALVELDDISELVHLNIQFEENYKEISKQLSAARRYQEELFTESYNDEHLSSKAFERPAFELSGDFFHISKIGNRHLIVIGDVQSHGIDVALKAITLLHLCRPGHQTEINAESLLPKLNEFVCEDNALHFWSSCILVALYDQEKRTLNYCRAGIPEPILANENKELFSLPTGNTPLGYFAEEDYISETVKIKPGYRMLLFTDGVTEVKSKDQDDDLFGVERLMDTYRDLINANAKNAVLDLVETLSQFNGSNEFEDDLTLAEIFFK